MCHHLRHFEQITIGTMNFHPVKSCRHGLFGGLAKLVHNLRNFIQRQCMGRFKGFESFISEAFPLRRDGGRSHRQFPIMKGRVRHPADVPQLQENMSAFLMNRIRYFLPARYLIRIMNPWGEGIPDASR